MFEQREYGPQSTFGDMEIERDPFRGVVLRVSSKEIHAFFSRLKTEEEGVKVSKKWGGLKYYNILPNNLPVIDDVTFASPGEGMFVGNILNLSFLRAVDLDKGIEIVYPGLIQEPLKESFRKGVLDRVQLLYGDFIRPSAVRTLFTVQTLYR